MQKRVYLDYASGINNPGSISKEGVAAKQELENARAIVAKFFSARPGEIVFTSGGTEANNIAIQGTLWPALGLLGKTPLHIITTNIEHASVLETCKLLEKTGHVKVTYVPVEENGIVDPKKIKEAITKNTVLVSVQYANNEIGTIQPIKEIAKEIRHWKKNNLLLRHPDESRDPGQGALKSESHHFQETALAWIPGQARDDTRYPLFHTDACQVMQYLPMQADALGVDLITVNGSKIDGTRGVGALYIKTGTPITNIMGGGDQEQGLRPGTENIDAITKFAQAVSKIPAFAGAASAGEEKNNKMVILRDFCISEIKKIIPSVILNGDEEKRLPNNINITIPNISSELLVIGVDALGFAISEKSACKAGADGVSHVIKAIRPKETNGSLRITLGKSTTKKDIQNFVKALKTVCDRQKNI